MLRNPKTGDVAAKIQLNFRKIGTFGWIFSTKDAFRKAGLSNLIDNTLGNKGINTKYAYSHIVENLMSTHLCGGECIEDRNLLRRPGWLNPVAEIVIAAAPFITIKDRKYSAQRLYGKQNHSRQQPWTLMALLPSKNKPHLCRIKAQAREKCKYCCV